MYTSRCRAVSNVCVRRRNVRVLIRVWIKGKYYVKSPRQNYSTLCVHISVSSFIKWIVVFNCFKIKRGYVFPFNKTNNNNNNNTTTYYNTNMVTSFRTIIWNTAYNIYQFEANLSEMLNTEFIVSLEST